MVIADNLDHDLAGRIGVFINSFYDPAESRERKSHSADYYLWKLATNFHGKGFVSLAVDGDKLVGTTTVTRKTIWFRGHWVNAAEIGDTFTHPDYQRQGIFTSLVNATRDRALAEGIDLIYGTPNAASLAGYEKQCSFYRKRGLDLFLWVLPLGLSPVVSRYGGKPFNALYPDVLDRTLTLPLRIINAFVSRHCEKVPLAFGENFDSLDAQLRERHSFMLPRNAVELKSRLMENPDSNRYGVLVRRDRDAELQGVLIYKDTFQDGLRILFVADTFAIDHSSLTHLWNAALEMAFRLRYDLIAVWAQRSWSSIASMLPVPPVPVVRKEVIIYDYGRGREALNDCGSWRFSILDSDNI